MELESALEGVEALFVELDNFSVSLERSDTESSNGVRVIVTLFLALQADCVASNGLALLARLLEVELTALCVELEATELVTLEPLAGLVILDELETFSDEPDVLPELALCVDVVGR